MKFKLKHNKDFMNAFDKYTKFDSSIEIFVPSTIDVDKPINNTEWVDKTMSFLIKKFGGATSYNSFGGWESSEGFEVKEGLTCVVSYTDKNKFNAESKSCEDFIKFMKKELRQEAIMVKIDGKPCLI